MEESICVRIGPSSAGSGAWHSSMFCASFSLLHCRQNRQCLRVPLSLIEFVKHPAKDGIPPRNRFEQRHARLQLHFIRRAKNLVCRSALNGKNGFGTFTESLPKNGMSKVLARFLWALDGELLCSGTEPQAVDLRKDEPHPVAAFVASPDFGESAVVDAFLG